MNRLNVCIAAMLFGFALQVASADEFSLHNFERKQLTDVYFSEGANAGDINGDGTADVVYGPYWFAGPEYTTKHEIYEPVPQNMDRYADNFFSWVYDFNGDGRSDVFVVGFPGTPAYVYENPGDGNFGTHWTKHQVFDWVSNESPQLVDLVGDERPELVCTRDGHFGFVTVDWDDPLGTWNFHAISEKVTAAKFGHGLGIGDVNGDGRQDIIHAKGWYEQPAERPEGSRWQSHDVMFTTAYGGAEMYAYDVDGDGDNDVITSLAAHDFGLAWYEQIGSGDDVSFKQHLIMGSHPSENKYGVLFSELHSVNLVDIDGDGLKDIVTGKTYWSHHRQSPMWDAGAVVYWFRLVRGEGGVDWVPYQADGEAGIGRQLSIADINADGLPDIVVGGMKGAHVLTHQKTTVDEAVWKDAQPKIYDGEPKPSTEGAQSSRGPKSQINGRGGRVAGAVEAELLPAQVTAGRIRTQSMANFQGDNWSGNAQMWWTGARPGDKLTIKLPPKTGTVDLEFVLTRARDYGIVQLTMDNEPLGKPIDLYSPEVVTTGVLTFRNVILKPGPHTLAVQILGANPRAEKAYMFGFDYLRLASEGEESPAPEPVETGFPATASNGRVLNLDFEKGTLEDWTATGNAFEGQPIKGDTVGPRRRGSRSGHQGDYWIGGFEKVQDAPTGTLTSVPFVVRHPFATFLMNGGSHESTRVELVRQDSGRVCYMINGQDDEEMRQIVVDLRGHMGKEIFIRLVDEHKGGWGHVNFDHFRFQDIRPTRPTPGMLQLVADEYPHAGLTGEQAAESMKLPDGFSVALGAAEPEVKQPIAMALDDRGRVWVAEAYEYPFRAEGEKGRDRILVFEDTDGDGSLDKKKVFAEGLNLISGLEVGFGGVWVGAAPYLLFIPDRDGDDVPDAAPQKLLDGWGYQDTHETLNAFTWGPDGWLYGCHGVFTQSRVGKPGTADEDRIPLNAAVWRYHPIRHEFDVFAHGTSNPWGVDFNDHGQAFVTACVIPHLFHIIQGARYQRQAGQHFNPYTYRDIVTIADHLHYLGATPHTGNSKSDAVGGGHAHAGAMIYLGGVWPDRYRNQIFMNNIHGQRLNMDILKPNGSGYVGSHGPDFLLTGDQASQILNLRYGPDGQAWMIDWYDMQACHRRDASVHDRSNGRIYKISYGKSANTSVNLQELSDLELAEQALNENDWYVRHSRRILQERAAIRSIDAAAQERLLSIATTHAEDARRLRAMWALHVIGKFDAKLANQLLSDRSPYVRGWAIQLALEESTGPLAPAVVNRLTQVAREDESQVVRMYVASALQRIPLEQRWPILNALTSHSEDAGDHNLPLMYWYAAEPLAEIDAERALALGLAAGESIPVLREFMLRRIGSSDVDALPLLVGGLGRARDDELQLTFLKAIRAALQGQRQVKPPAEWEAVAASLARSGNEEVRLQARALGVTFGDKAAVTSFRALVNSKTADDASRREALESLLAANAPQLVGLLQELVGDSAVRDIALGGLAQFDDPGTASLVLSAYSGLSPKEKRIALGTLCSRAAYAKELLNAIEQKRVAGTDLTADLVRRLQYLRDDEINQRLLEVWGNVRETAEDKVRMIAEYKQLLASPGEADVALGRAVFAKTCQRCHTLYGIGERIGPDLTGSNRTNLDYLLSNIIDPSAVMAKEYRQSIIITTNGRVITGIVRSENDNAVTIQTAEATVIVPKDEIDERIASDKSMMPDDQFKQFSEHEVRSVIAYLSGKQQAPLLATRENSSLMFNGKDLAGWHGRADLWSVENGELVGRTEGLRRNEWIVSDLTATDFRLRLEVKLVDNAGNSGIQFRSEAHDGSVSGYQADIGAGWWGKLYEEHGRALLWKESGEEHVKLGDWNTYEVHAEASRIRTYINGQLCVDLDDPKGARRGIFAFQLHSGGKTEVRFRKIQLEVLDEFVPAANVAGD